MVFVVWYVHHWNGRPKSYSLGLELQLRFNYKCLKVKINLVWNVALFIVHTLSGRAFNAYNKLFCTT